MLDGAKAARKETGVRPTGGAFSLPKPAFSQPKPGYSQLKPAVPIVLVAAAIFLIVMVLARTPLKGYILSQRVQAADDRSATNTPLATEQVAAWLKADAVLASTVQQVCPRDSLATQSALIAHLARSLQVQSHDASTRRAGWQLNLQHHDRQLASRLLQQLSDSLTSQLKHLDQAETQLLVQHLQTVLAPAREEEDSARLALDRARHEELSLVMQKGDRTPTATPVAPASPLPTSASKTNPGWLELQQKVATAQARLDQLLAARTAEHPQVIEAQSRLSQLKQQLEQTPREPDQMQQNASPNLQGPELPESASRQSRVPVRLVSSAGESSPSEQAALTKQIQQLTLQWTTATARRTSAERAYNEAQQQWVRGLNAEGWQASAVWTQAQQGGRATPFQLLLAAILAVLGGLATWRLGQLANRCGLLSSVMQLNEALPLPVLGEVPQSMTEPKRLPAHLNTQVLRLAQFSLAVVLAVMFVCVWATSTDSNLSSQWTSDPLSALGQAFDLLHHRVIG